MSAALDARFKDLMWIGQINIVSVDWLVKYLVDKPDETVNEMLDSILEYMDAIPADSEVGSKITALREAA